MNIFPAIDLFNGCAVRLYKGNYDKMTVYSENPLEIALNFERHGARFIHIVDLEGAKNGTTPNIETIKQIVKETSLFVEVGGGIRTPETVKAYLDGGADRVILGTAAVENESFLREIVEKYGEKIAVGVDIKNGFVATRGWTEKSQYTCFDFCKKMQEIGVQTIICTDISRDGTMQGTNRELYKELSERFGLDIVASGGVSTLDDINALRDMGLYGAIIGKAYYTGNINLSEALEAAK